MPETPVDLYPQLTQYAAERLNNAVAPTKTPNKVPYLGYFAEDDKPYDVTDYPEVRRRIANNVTSAIARRFPLESDKYILTLENLHYLDKEFTPRDEKDALLRGKTLGTRLRGDWVLYDKKTGKELQRKAENTLVNIPYLTDRGVFIRSGNEYGLRNMFRLRPGMYTRIRGDGYIATHVNPAQGTGRQSNIVLSPENGVFTWKMGTRNYGLLPILLASGKSPEEIKAAWGDELFDNNYKKYEGIITGSSKREAEEYQKLWDEDLSRGLLDEETTATTLGRPHKKLTGDAILDATNKILHVAQTYSDEETDDRDGLQFQTIMGAADYLPERIVRDGGGLFKKILNRIDKDGNLDSIKPGAFQPHVDAVFQEDRHAGYIDGANPLEAVDFASSLSRIGEGGLGTDRAASEESRGVHNSYLGFVDPIRSSESQAVGLQVYLNHGVKKDSKGRLWTLVRTPGNPKPTYQDMHTLSHSVVATPEYFDPKADPEEFIPAFRNGGDLEYIPRKDVNYYIADSSNMMSDNTGFIAGIGGIRSNRTLLGSKASIQSLSLPNREAPLVQRYLSTEDGDTTTEAYMGKKLGAKFAEEPGKVISVDSDEIKYRGKSGKTYKVNLYNDLPANNKGWLTNTPMVKPGDIVEPGQVLAKSNYTDDNGNAAVGVNLRVAYVSAPNGGSSLDAITVSESAAKTKLASEQLYKTKAPRDNETEYDKNRFLRAFDSSDFTKEQLETIGDDGIVKPGTVLHKGDPMVLGIKLKDAGIHGVSRKGMSPLIKVWEHDYPGTVIDVGDASKNYTVITKATVPAKIGDKMCYSEDTDILTGNRGWIPIKELTPNDIVYTINPETGIMELQQPTKVFRYEHSGSMYHIETPQLDLLVTPNHQNLVDVTSTRHKFVDKFELVGVSELFGKRAMYKKDGIWASEYREKYELPGYTEKCGQFGHGTTVVEPAYKDPETFLPLLGLWLAEGSATIVPGNYIVSIAQKTPEKCIKLEKILNNSGYKWYLNGHNYIIRDKQLTLYLKQFGYCYQKYIPEEVFRYSADIQRLFFAGIMLGDGSYNKQGRPVCYTTTSRRLADDMVRLCLNIGYAANVQVKPIGDPVWFERDQRYIVQRRPCYSVRIITNKLNPKVHFHNKPSEKNHVEEWVDYSGYVYCCEVPKYHTLYVRRNDKPVWSGNSSTFGNKGVIGQILPDDEMLRDANGQPFEVYQSPMGIPSRVNPMVLASLQLGKIAKHTGQPIVWKDFSSESTVDKVLQMLKDNGLEESENLYDPVSGKTIPDVDTGYLYYLKFKHMGDVKEKARGTGDYTMEDLPLKGGHESARRFGSMEIGALFGHTGLDSEVMRDTKLIRGQENNAFWKAVRNGDALPSIDTPLVHKKFFAHLLAAGVNLEDRGNRIHMFAADDNDIKNLTQNRQVLNNSTYDAKDLRPIQGGLFDPAIFGANGDQWAYYQLPEPVLNPLMEKAVNSILGWKEKDFQGVLNGEQEINGKTGPAAVREILSKMDLEREFKEARHQLKSTTLPAIKRDKLLKKYRALAGLIRERKNPADLFLTRIPILPPRFRPVSVLGNDVGIVSDANYLYKAMIDASQDFEDAKKTLPEEMQLDARKGLHQAISAVIGLTDSPDKKLQDKNVEGVLKWAFGKGSPKFGSLHRKVFGATADLGGLAVISPDSRLGIDEVGLPEDSAWAAFEPFAVRNLRRQGFPLAKAIQAVEERTPEARKALEQELKKRPVLVNRAPTLHKYNIMAFWPRITNGSTIRYNPLVSKGFNSDHDGDSISNMIMVSIPQETLKRLLKTSELGVYYSSNQPNEKGTTMIEKESRLALFSATMRIQDIPVVAESAVQKSETVTEWDCQPKWYVDTIDPETGDKVCVPITKVSKHTGLTMYNVHISDSGAYKRVVVASEDHSLITYNPETMKLEKSTPVESVGRLVPVMHGGRINTPANCLKTLNIGVQVPMSYRLGEFIGAMLGDGWVDSTGQVYMAANCPDIREHIWGLVVDTDNPVVPMGRKSLDQVMSNAGSFGKSEKHKLRLGLTVDAARDLKKLIGSGAENKRIPWQCLCGSRAHLAGLLSGLLSTDGSVSCVPCSKKKTLTKVIHYDTVSTYLRDSIQDLCRRLGIRTSVRVYRGPNSTMDCYSVSLSCEDMKTFVESTPQFKLFYAPSQEALDTMFAELSANPPLNRGEIVPVPSILRGELAYVQDPEAKNWATAVCVMVKAGSITRKAALKIVERMESADWSAYKDYGKHKHTPEQAKELAEEWCTLVRNTDIRWSKIDRVTPSSCTEGWDLTVPGPYTFSLWDGTVVQDTMNFHVPVSKKAVAEAARKMLPSRNLFNPATLKSQILPLEEFSQGLYIASRPGKGTPIRFRTKADMLRALNAGEIGYDTPVDILELGNRK